MRSKKCNDIPNLLLFEVFHDCCKTKIGKSLIFSFILTRKDDVFLPLAIIYLPENRVVAKKYRAKRKKRSTIYKIYIL